MARPFLSLTAIMKNEEAEVAACLESAKTICDELVVVDTGSTDRTAEIARAHGATVHHFAWVDDFSAARNAALEHATGEWCLILDADERVAESAPGALRAELKSLPPEVSFLIVPVRSPGAGGIGVQMAYSRRVLRNDPAIRWRFPIHENLVHAGGDGPHREAHSRTLVVHHGGYADPAERRARGKHERNLRILRRELKTRGDDAFVHYYLARELIASGQYREAIGVVDRCLARLGDGMAPPFRAAMLTNGVRSALALGDNARSLAFAERAWAEYPYAELAYLMGVALVPLGRLDEAERALNDALRLADEPFPLATDSTASGWKTWQELGSVAWMRGDREEALARWRRAHELAPDEHTPRGLLGVALSALGRPDEAAPHLRAAADADPADRSTQAALARVLAQSGEIQEAYDRLDALTRAHPEVPEYWEMLGELLRDAGEPDACVATVARALERHPERPRLYRALAGALRALGREQDARNADTLAARYGG